MIYVNRTLSESRDKFGQGLRSDPIMFREPYQAAIQLARDLRGNGNLWTVATNVIHVQNYTDFRYCDQLWELCRYSGDAESMSVLKEFAFARQAPYHTCISLLPERPGGGELLELVGAHEKRLRLALLVSCGVPKGEIIQSLGHSLDDLIAGVELWKNTPGISWSQVLN